MGERDGGAAAGEAEVPAGVWGGVRLQVLLPSVWSFQGEVPRLPQVTTPGVSEDGGSGRVVCVGSFKFGFSFFTSGVGLGGAVVLVLQAPREDIVEGGDVGGR